VSSPQADVSIVLPVQDGRADSSGRFEALGRNVGAYVDALDATGWRWELLLVPDHPTQAAVQGLQSSYAQVVACAPAAGWGRAVRAGLQESRGELLCYANYERTSSTVLVEMLAIAHRNPSLVLRANRRTRDTVVQRIGSLLFNLECRMLLGIPAWDVNGTPKVFPRSFGRLLELSSEGDLFDAEFAAVCERSRYPVVEVPIDASLPAGVLRARPRLGSALKMYLGVPAVRRRTGTAESVSYEGPVPGARPL